MNFLNCRDCGKSLSTDEIAIYKKMVNRGATSFLCITCLSAHFDCTEDDLREKIEYFRKSGCTLFPTKDSNVNVEAKNDL